MNFEQFSKNYSVSKTIGAELVPVGETLANIKKDNIIACDAELARAYVRAKELLDLYHKSFIERTLANVHLSGIGKAAIAYANRGKEKDKELENAFSELRNEIANAFKSQPEFDSLFKAEMFKELLPGFLKDEADKKIIESFFGFTSYFTGFNSIRANLYSSEAKNSSVAYRAIDENLPVFLDDIAIFGEVKAAGIDTYSAENEYGGEIDSLFDVSAYTSLLTQKNISLFNLVVGQLNMIINQHNQHLSEGERRLPKMKTLYKQLLCDENKTVLIPEFKTDEEVINTLKLFTAEMEKLFAGNQFKAFLHELNASGGVGVYVKNDTALSDLAVATGFKWDHFKHALSLQYDKAYTGKKTGAKREEEKAAALKKVKSYTLESLMTATEDMKLVQAYTGSIKLVAEDFTFAKKGMLDAIADHDADKRLQNNSRVAESIKIALDVLVKMLRLVKLISGTKLESDRNELVYGEWNQVLAELSGITSVYNMTRNYLTKKIFSQEKVKLNFGSASLLAGWDKNKEDTNLGTILLKDGKYFLAIANTDNRKIMANAPAAKTSDTYSKLEIKLLPGPNKMLPKVCFAKSNIERFKPSEEVLAVYKNGTFKKGDSFSLDDCHLLIDYFKQCISLYPDWAAMDFNFSDTDKYEDISGFYNEIEHQGYKTTFRPIDREYVDRAVAEGGIYMFELTCRDLKEAAKGRLNLHTVYLKSLFDAENIKNPTYRLCGGAEIFFRPASITAEDMIVHPAGVPIKNKNPEVAKIKPTSTFSYDIVKDRRYTVDKFLIHLPISMNAGAKMAESTNAAVNREIRESGTTNVIGLKRGENNLLYAVVIDPNGRILEQKSLNAITSTGARKVSIDYNALLESREKERMTARQNWMNIEGIKDLKAGYLSQIVSIITSMVFRYNAIIVLEDLDDRFKQQRGGRIEKSVYQQLEKALIDKLSYIVTDKSRTQDGKNSLGGAFNALQLTAPFESFSKIQQQKQTGIIYYAPAMHTVAIDPTTGFCSLFDLKYENMSKAQRFILSFDSIRYNETKKYFEFETDYSRFTFKAEGTKEKWTICSFGERVEQFHNPEKNGEWDRRRVNVTEELKKFLNAVKIEFESGRDIKEDLAKMTKASQLEEFMRVFGLIVQLRNGSFDGCSDYIQSPVINKMGSFFRSSEQNSDMPTNIDANGAYNLARKGLLLLDRVYASDDDSYPKLSISNKDWLRFAQAS